MVGSLSFVMTRTKNEEWRMSLYLIGDELIISDMVHEGKVRQAKTGD